MPTSETATATCEVCGAAFPLLEGSLVACRPRDRLGEDAWAIGCTSCSNEWRYWLSIGPGFGPNYLLRSQEEANRLTNHVALKGWFRVDSFLGCVERLNALLPESSRLDVGQLSMACRRYDPSYYKVSSSERSLVPAEARATRVTETGARRVRAGMSLRLRFTVMERDGFRCVYCGANGPGTKLHVDHVVPVSAGGGNDRANLVTACGDCNSGKAARLLTSYPPTARA